MVEAAERAGVSVLLNALLVTAGGAVVFAVGLAIQRNAYTLTRFGEILDALGSKRRASEVEPTAFNVLGTEVVAHLLMIFGGFVVLVGTLTALANL